MDHTRSPKWFENYFCYYTYIMWSRKQRVSVAGTRAVWWKLHVLVASAVADDPLVSKTFPASAKCRRTKQQRMDERSNATTEK